MAFFGAATLGTIASIASGDALETGVALGAQRIYNYGYRKTHPLTHTNPGAKRARSKGGSFPPGQYPSPKRLKMSTPTRSRSIDHHMSDASHGTSISNSNSTIGARLDNLRVGKLYARRWQLPGQSNLPERINVRDGNIRVSGIKVHREFTGVHCDNTLTPTQSSTGYMGPMVLNWALIQFKCQVSETDDSVTATRLLAKFFTDDTANNLWYAPFVEYPDNGTPATLKSGYDVKHIWGNMCKHNDYRILARKRCKFHQIQDNGVRGSHNNQTKCTIHQFYRMPQNIYLEDPQNLLTWEHPIFEIWWATPQNMHFLENYPSTGVPDHYETQWKNTTYFKKIND